jgi:hypothetical protein
METLTISAGEYTEDMLQFVLAEMTDEQIDDLEIDRGLARGHGLQSEPVTISVVIGGAAVVAVARLIGQWLESRRQVKAMEMVATGYGVDSEVGRAMLDLAKAHAGVAARFAEASSGGVET